MNIIAIFLRDIVIALSIASIIVPGPILQDTVYIPDRKYRMEEDR